MPHSHSKGAGVTRRIREERPIATPQEQAKMSRVLRESSSRSRKYEDAEAPVGRRNTWDSLFPVPGCSIWTKKMKDHAFRSHLSSFFQLPVKVTGVDPTVLRQLGEALEMIGGFVCGSGAKDLLKLVNYRILFPRLYSH
jgi:hypothetical protein